MQAYLDSVGAQMAMQIQAMPPGQRHALTQRVSLGGQYAADVTVTGDAGDLRSLAGFGYTVVDTDPDRTRLIGLAQGQAADAAGARAAGNELLAVLDEAQARVDMAYAGLPAGARTDKMLGVARQFVDAGRDAAAAANWNLVQTFETAADVSLQIAAQPEGSRTALTERFMHKKVKHDITVDPNSADPFATFKDHSKGQDTVGAIVEGGVGVVVNLATLIPGTQAITVPLAVAWDTAQAGKNFAQGNILGGFLNLGAAAGVGVVGLGTVSQAGVGAEAGSFAADAGKVADSVATSLGFTAAPATATTAATTAAQTAANAGTQILQGTALVGGLSGVAQSAARGDALGMATGVLEAASAVAGGLVSTGTLTDPAAWEFARQVSVGAGIASVGASSADAFAHGDLAGGLLSSLNALLTQVAAQVGSKAAPATPTTPTVPAPDAPGGGATGPFDGPGVDGDGPLTPAQPSAPAGTGSGTTATDARPAVQAPPRRQQRLRE